MINENRLFMGGFFIEKYEQQQVCGCLQKKLPAWDGLLERSFLNLQMLLQINLWKAVRFKNIKINGVDHY